MKRTIVALQDDIKAAIDSKDFHFVNKSIQDCLAFGLHCGELAQAQKCKSKMDVMIKSLRQRSYAASCRSFERVSCTVLHHGSDHTKGLP